MLIAMYSNFRTSILSKLGHKSTGKLPWLYLYSVPIDSCHDFILALLTAAMTQFFILFSLTAAMTLSLVHSYWQLSWLYLYSVPIDGCHDCLYSGPIDGCHDSVVIPFLMTAAMTLSLFHSNWQLSWPYSVPTDIYHDYLCFIAIDLYSLSVDSCHDCSIPVDSCYDSIFILLLFIAAVTIFIPFLVVAAVTIFIPFICG